ncbi:MAG: tetratricopeptide repeat protein [Candidatus Omnitrophica bacterium]|nr:tetratricopeptide repeat protein [Candidatus Omnitrophota bacterium]
MERKRRAFVIGVIGVIAFYFCVVHVAAADEVKQYLVEDEGSVALIQKAWEALGEKDLEKVLFYTNKCVKLYGRRAARMQGKLNGYPTEEAEIHRYWALNDVATAYFIQAEAYRKAGDLEKAREAYKTIIEKYAFGQCWDPKGWFWKPADAAGDAIAMMDKGLDLDFGDYRSVTLVVNAWKALDEEKLEEVLVYTDKCIKLYSQEAARMQKALKGYPEGSDEEIFAYWALNDVATAYFIQGEAYRKKGEAAKAREAYQKIIDEFFYGQCWDPKGWFWKLADAAANRLNILEEDRGIRDTTFNFSQK